MTLTQALLIDVHSMHSFSTSVEMHPKVLLSKGAQVALALEQQEKSLQFKNALDSAWTQINDTTKNIAIAHHKSVRHVQHNLYFGHMMHHMRCTKANAWNVFFWKKSMKMRIRLPTLVQDFCTEYQALTNNDKAALIEEFQKFKGTKSSEYWVNSHSKINDVMHTLKAVENKLNGLHCRTSTETILFATCSSTDVPMNGVAFATKGVQDFMGTVMGIGNQDFISKMEGYAIQGIKGATANHSHCISQIHIAIRNLINKKLCWPDNIPFSNLSTVSSAQPQLKMLLRKWESGTTYWKELTEEGYENLHTERNKQLETGEITEATHCSQSDKGKKHQKHPADATDSQEHCAAKQRSYKSSETVNSKDMGQEIDNTRQETNSSSPSAWTQTPIPSPSLATAFANLSNQDYQNLLTNLTASPLIPA
ncbi:hypothetical protein HYDPIDRAFT_170963 [Hydnomerulius pinastri MD-312]|uniref:Uncharacterized protein n=1 Tax=Hydnomerulius pinastri MD-312 TaxID=994086 RepID=A0A0C9V1I8_9AGAM|nr:hypothetical protein HYDPIDRAFT_170963 [Hydnomerulius pinastri MD-312]